MSKRISMAPAATCRFIVRVIAVLMLLIVHCDSFIFALEAADAAPKQALPSLDVVTAEYTQAVSALRSIDCSFTISIHHLSEKTQEDSRLTAMNVRYLRDGFKVAMKISGDANTGKKAIDMWVAFNGEKYSEWSESARVDAQEGYFAPRGTITSNEPTMMNAVPTIETFLGKRVGGGPLDLESLLKRSETNITGWENVAGDPCIRVDLGEHPRSPKNSTLLSHTVVLLDPKHSFLPRSITTTHLGKTISKKVVVINTFEAIPDASEKGASLWLPKSGAVTNSLTRRDFDFTSFKINIALDNSEFVPRFPQGAMVGENIAGKPESSFLVGTPELREALNDRATLPETSAKKQISPAEADAAGRLSAKPELKNGIWWLIGIAGLVMITVAVFIQRRTG